ncbi:beta-galactosidase/beta-glucuronidase [Silvibacterium bohemicum]|uniref:Beta-galactosidase/beta-glucuronidase n=1 Tax=Silvibacterium bohemicum TaxID=1577686 RepID=A0A841K001_9BACT|nr:glycoside hydrolase family 2 TIM barrel-domain containing protein [Silvibacterium bohemicum]MBB6144541.1 beta-galactosidase/beta-glucuronidase [Silvibacterium bohemicum]
MAIDPARLHPRPQFRRTSFELLNGIWDFCIDERAEAKVPHEISWTRAILVPFSPETASSGIGDTKFYSAVWYRRRFASPVLSDDQRLLLHFEAVDYRATIWLNGAKVCEHEGGYTPFVIDITDALQTEGAQELVVRAEDDPADLAKPRGKQDWKLDPHSIWYPRTTGIWQTVWLETVSTIRIGSLQWSSNLERWEIGLDAIINAPAKGKLMLHVGLRCGDQVLADDRYEVICGEVHRRIALSDPGIDDYRNALLWSPSSPTLIDAVVELRDEAGQLLDAVTSYTALRSISAQGDRFLLNGRPLNLRMVLDQGYWPDSGLTPPSDEALEQDVLLAKRLGFNGVRKHQKVECARYLHWADKLGLLVWEEMPSAYRYTTQSIQRLTREWMQVIERDRSHPCIVAWVPFNESWGVPDLPESPAQRHYVQALYHLTKALDPTRLVIGNDGWESVATDIIGIHDYDGQPERIGKRYGINDIEEHLFERERPGGRMLLLGEDRAWKHPIVLTEFGGIALTNEVDTWGYSKTSTAEEFANQYAALLAVVRNLPALAGFCYTQFADTYQEANGLLHADRTPKVPLEKIALATTGSLPDQDIHTAMLWRKHLMNHGS